MSTHLTKEKILTTCARTEAQKKKTFFQARLQVGPVNDIYEQEADAVAEKVLRTQTGVTHSEISPVNIQRKCSQCEDEQELQRKGDGATGRYASPIVDNVVKSQGQELDHGTRSFMEQRFGYNFNQVRIHTDSQAVASAQSVNALAYTSGKNIVFNQGQYSPGSEQGKRLLAHELTHVVQQSKGQSSTIQRACGANFCNPYPTAADAASAEWWLMNTWMVIEGYPTYGPEVADLYERFLTRRPGDSLAPVVFDSAGSYVVRSFISSWDTKDDVDEVIDLVGSRLGRTPGGVSSLRPYSPTMMSLSNFLSQSELDNRPINYSNPLSVAGHIAGGIGSSDAGPDYRKITQANVTLEKVQVPLIGSEYVLVTLNPRYEVFDAIDFCPGDCGSPLEEMVTTSMSRLEATGEAYDVPFKVIFRADARSKRFWL